MADIFLSYANEDREAALKISRLLESAGWTVWWDRRIPAGRSWRSVLEEALGQMRGMVVLWSKRSIESDWVKEEAEEARELITRHQRPRDDCNWVEYANVRIVSA